MNLLRLSLNLLRRDWRAGEWRVLLLALVLAVGSLATVGLFADRVRQALQQQAQSLIVPICVHFDTSVAAGLSRDGAGARLADGVEHDLSEHGAASRAEFAERDSGGGGGLSVAGRLRLMGG